MAKATGSFQAQDLREVGNDMFIVVGEWTVVNYDDGSQSSSYTPYPAAYAEYMQIQAEQEQTFKMLNRVLNV